MEPEKRVPFWEEVKGLEKDGKQKPSGKSGDGGRERTARNARAVFETAEEFTQAAEEYFRQCDAGEVLYDEAGLCLYLSGHNPKERPVTARTLRSWYDGERARHLQEAVQMAYLRIQHQIATDPRYQEKSGMVTKALFLLKQSRLGGYNDKGEQKEPAQVVIRFGETVEKEDFL